MDLDIPGVIKKNFLSLSNYSLTSQLLLINFFASFIGLIFLFLINFYLIQNDKSIDFKINDTKNKLKSTASFLENNSIARIPLFRNCRINNLVEQSCKIENVDNKIQLSELELEPTSAQQYIIQNFLDSDLNISIYNNSMIEIINSSTLFIGNKATSNIIVKEISDNKFNNQNSLNLYQDFYSNLFNFFYSKVIRKKYINDIVKKKHDIIIFKETNKKRRLISHKIIDDDNNIIHFSSIPIISNNKVYGIAITSLLIDGKNNELAFTSFILFNFYVIFIFVTVSLSLFFVRGLVIPLQQLSKLTLIERQKFRKVPSFKYPNRKDEIGILSTEIQNMSHDLKLQMFELEKFTTDIAHELKNPLTAIKSSSELLLKNKISDENKLIVIKNFNKEVDRMNRLISDISNFSRTISEIEKESFKLIDLNVFLNHLQINYLGNKKNINLILQKENKNLKVLLNEDKFFQVILNLIDNSVSISPINSFILITTNQIDKKTALIKIYDQGKGISLKHKDKIFNRFYTDRDEFRDNHSGLGLSISKEILKSFKGSIELTKSDNFDFRGACFMIKLPLIHTL